VYWLIFAIPASPSFWSCSSFGITTVRSWRMIEAVTYGMMPSANRENCESAPPEKTFRRPRMVPPWLLK
jgi:hypothetical protein